MKELNGFGMNYKCKSGHKCRYNKDKWKRRIVFRILKNKIEIPIYNEQKIRR